MIYTAVDGVQTNTANVAEGSTFEVDFYFTNMVVNTKYKGTGVQVSVPAGWGVAPGTANAPGLPGWHSSWDVANGVPVGWGAMYSTANPFASSPDGYTINYNGTSWDIGARDAAFDDGSAGDLDGTANKMGADARITVPAGTLNGTYQVVVMGAGHNETDTKAAIWQTITITVGPAGPSVSLGDGTNPANATFGPSASATFADAFTLAVSSGTDSATAVTLNLGAGAAAGLALVEVTDDAGTTVHGSVANPATDTPSISLTTPIPITTTPTQYKIRITPKSHLAMDGPPGATYTVTPVVTALTATNPVTGSDGASATITVDNASPGEVTGLTGTPGDGQVALAWTNPGVDFTQTVVLRGTASIGDRPAEGASYTAGGTLGATTVVYAGAGAAHTDATAVNGTAYYYKAFTKDAYGNYSAAGVETGPHTPQVAAADTILGDGTNPGNASLAPGGAATFLDSFTLATSAGADTVTAVTVTLAAGTSAGLSLVEVTNDAGSVVHGSLAPSGDTVAITLTSSISVTTAPTQYRVRITPKTHVAMPVPPGASYPVTGTVTSIAAGNAVTGGDAASATVTIDNLSPGNATWGSVTPSSGQVALNWTNPGDGDFSQVVILRSTATVADAPAEGGAYAAGNTIGASTVRYVGGLTSFTDTGLTNGTAYYYKVFAKDTNGNYATGSPTGPHTPAAATTSVGDGTNPGNASLAPGGAATGLDAFTVQTSAGTDSITALTVTLAAGTSAGIGLVEITNDAGGTVYGSQAPSGDTVAITLGTTLPATTTPTQYRVRITPKTHVAMPLPPGASYAVTGTVTAVTCSNSPSVNDIASATVTIDNLSPGNATWGSVTPSSGQVALTWTNPGDGDFSQVVILRSTASIADAPAEGGTYAAGNTIGASTVRYVGSLASFTDTGLTNGTAYYYKVFAKDTNGNYATGTPTGPHTPAAATTTVGDGTNPGNASLAPGGAATGLDAFTVQTSTGIDSLTAVTVTLAAGTSAGLSLVEITNDGGGTVYGSQAPSGDTVALTLGTPIPATTTATQYRVRITPKTHAAMPVPPGASYAVTGTVTAITCSNSATVNDTASATVTIDNLSPGNVTWGGASTGNGSVSLTWTNPGGDFSQVVILRSTAAISAFPAEGASYSVGNTVGAATVRYAGTGTSLVDSGLTNGTAYYYKAFPKDASGNYATGSPTGPHTPSASDLDAPCAAGGLLVSDRTPTSVTLQFTAPFENCAGSSGTPTSYMVRHAYRAIGAGTWDEASAWDDAYPAAAAAGATESITITGLDSNQRYWVQVKAVDAASNVGPLAALAGAGSDATRTYLHGGWNIGGAEGTVGGSPSCLTVFGLSTCYAWASTGVGDWTGSYVAASSVQSGKAYWLSVGGSTTDLVPSGTTATTGTVSVTLQKGMNLVVNPHDLSVDLSALTVSQNGGPAQSWATAVGNGWVLPAVYPYDGTNYNPEVYNTFPPGKLHPRKGYWVKLLMDDANTYVVNLPKPAQ